MLLSRKVDDATTIGKHDVEHEASRAEQLVVTIVTVYEEHTLTNNI